MPAMAPSPTSLERLPALRDHPLLRHLDEAELRGVLRGRRVERYAPGELVFKKGAPETDLLIVVDGRVKLSATSAAGHELLIHIAVPGDSFGELALIDGKPRSFDAAALEPTALVALPRGVLLPLVARRPELGLALLQNLCRRARRSEAMIEDALFNGVGPRLARQLLRMATRDGHAGRWQVALSQQALASLIGVTRESVNKQLSAWQRAGLVALRRGVITLQAPHRLRRICGDEHHPPEPGPSPFPRRPLAANSASA